MSARRKYPTFIEQREVILKLELAECALFGDARNYVEDDSEVNKASLRISALCFASRFNRAERLLARKRRRK